MPAVLILKKELPKHKFFIFSKSCYFVVGGPIDMNISLLSGASVGFLKRVVSQLFPKHSESYVNLNDKNSMVPKK